MDSVESPSSRSLAALARFPVQLFPVRRRFPARNSTPFPRSPFRDCCICSLCRRGINGAPTRPHFRLPPFGMIPHYFLICNKGRVEDAHATTFLLSRRQNVLVIHGVAPGAIAFPRQGFQSVHGISSVAITFLFNRIGHHQAALQYNIGIFFARPLRRRSSCNPA